MIRRTTVAALLALCLAPAATAQTVPFGKNKIQYRDFDWHVLSGEHIDVYYYPEEETLARMALAYAEECYRDLERLFQHHPFRRIPLIIYSSHQHFEQTNVYPGFIPEGVLGFTEYLKRRVALPFRGDYAAFRHTLRHELVHAFQLSKLAEVQALHPRQGRVSPQAIHWWTEGLAEYWSSEQTAEDEMFIRDMVLTGRLPTIREFTYLRSYASYPLGAELHKYLAQRFGEEYIVQVYEEFWKYDSFERTLESVLGIDLDQLSREWKYELQQRYFPVYAARPPLEVSAEPVIYRGGSNFQPALYLPPDDSVPHLLFLSPRTGYTNLYLTPLNEGERGVRTVVEGERSAEFESFHAYESRIDINLAGIIAFVSKYMERDALFLWDLAEGKVVGRYQWPDLVGLKSPAWAPTGDRIVFEGLSNAGFSDLYTLDLTTHQRTALTRDHYRDKDPDWSPDGRFIVFSSDRTAFGRDGYSNLFLLDIVTGSITPLTYGAWNDESPRWSRDGSRIAFSSDREGVYDIYYVDRDGNGRRLTSTSGGAFDPEWLPNDEGLVFTGFSEGSFRIYRFRFTEDTTTLPTFALRDGVAPRLPLGDTPGDPGPPVVGWEWEGLDAPIVAQASSRRYNSWSKISLDFAGGDAVVAPGIGTAQGAQLLATDMLGNHIFFGGLSAVQADELSQIVDQFSGHLMYLNLTHRLNFGAAIYRFKGRFLDVSWDIYDEESYGSFFVASYPFSKFHRLEFQLGLEQSRRIDVEDIYEVGGGPSTQPDPRDLTREGIVASNYLSYVKDNTLWIPTGPIDGERYNVTLGLVTCFDCAIPSEVSGEPLVRGAAAENFVVSADYRRYFRTSLYSAYALRGYIFYSDGAIPARSVLGGTHRLRGYPRFSLAGSRVWLVNQEWRFPILNRWSLGFPFGELRLPGIQGAIFADIGSSWLETQSKPVGTWGSYGLGLRTSLGAPLVLRLDIGRRFRLGGAPPVDFDGADFNDTFVDFFFGFNY
jgi:hypothetical protein